MNRSASRSSVAPLLAIALLITVAVLASGVLGRTSTSTPSAPPASEVPSQPPVATPEPSVAPSEAPSEAPVDGDFRFDLDVATPHDVSVIVDDETDSVTDARSRQAGDGMSVRWSDALVENADEDTLVITWVGLPQDDVVRITVTEIDGAIVVSIEQAAPPANSDAMGHDRVVEIDFDGPVSADDVTVAVSN